MINAINKDSTGEEKSKGKERSWYSDTWRDRERERRAALERKRARVYPAKSQSRAFQ